MAMSVDDGFSDMPATEQIWNEYHSRLLSFLRKRVGDDIAEDILQHVFVKVHSRIDTLKDVRKLESWLFQITRNAIVDYERSRKPARELPEWLEARVDSEQAAKRELSLCLVPMIERLPEKYRRAVYLSEIEGKTQRDVAEQEGLSFSGAKSRIQRGRELLKTMLCDCCVLEINGENQVLEYEKKDDSCSSC
jgi:RNA polymerase sigma-70 factor (ECF subfamily)